MDHAGGGPGEWDFMGCCWSTVSLGGVSRLSSDVLLFLVGNISYWGIFEETGEERSAGAPSGNWIT
jgi:hypothetical protein